MTSSSIPRHGVLSHLSEFRGLCFQEYRFSLYSLRFQGEFCRYSEGFYLCSVGLSRSTNKLCGKHMRTKKSSHPYGCCEFAPVSDSCRLQTTGCRLQTANYRLRTAYNGPQTVDYKGRWLTVQILKTAELFVLKLTLWPCERRFGYVLTV